MTDDFSIRLDNDGDGYPDRVVFAFASVDQDEFEWGATLENLGIPHVLVRDRTHAWYSGGVRGWGSIGDAAQRIEEIAEPYEQAIALGLSSGAYGALLFGAKAHLDTVIAISPVTGKDKDAHADIDPRYHDRVRHRPGDPLYQDLKPIYALDMRPFVHCFVSDGPGTEIDIQMARRVTPNLITLVPGYSHDQLGRGMRDTGLIGACLCR